MAYQKPKGTRDLYGRELARIEGVNAQARNFFRLGGYEEIRTPTFEFAELFVRSVGAGTDIVEKEMYTFEHDTKLFVLKPEGTAPVLRAVLENRLPVPGRFLYIASMFRKEKPQKGRFREFQQVGVEILGEDKPFYDAELIAQADQFFRLIGAGGFIIDINSIGCGECRAVYKEKLSAWLRPSAGRLCEDCRRRFERNFLRIFDCKNETCQAIYRDAPKITDNLGADCADHYRSVKSYLVRFGVEYCENKELVRGLDYYTRTVFEFKHPGLGAQDTFMAGGRYDRLMRELGGEDVPSIGWAMGVDRLLLILPEDKPLRVEPRTFFVAIMGEGLIPAALRLRDQILGKNQACILGDPGDSLKHQLKKADRVNAGYVLILGEDEIKNEYCTVRDMRISEQKKMSPADFDEFLKTK